MSSIILICDNIPTTHERLVELVKNLGAETQMLVIDDADKMSLVAPDRSVNIGVIGRRHSLTAMALSLGVLAGRPTMKAPPPPSLEKAFNMTEVFDEEFFFEKPKPNWPKPNHIRPTGQWIHRPAASHPARSRDKRFMR